MSRSVISLFIVMIQHEETLSKTDIDSLQFRRPHLTHVFVLEDYFYLRMSD